MIIGLGMEVNLLSLGQFGEYVRVGVTWKSCDFLSYVFT